jgi:hypothetical protein
MDEVAAPVFHEYELAPLAVTVACEPVQIVCVCGLTVTEEHTTSRVPDVLPTMTLVLL